MATIWMMPLFDARPLLFGLPNGVVVLAVALILLLVALLVIRHILGEDPLVRGEARWRYREQEESGDLLGLIDELFTWQGPDQTIGWWVTRIEFLLAAAALAVASLVVGLVGLHLVVAGDALDERSPAELVARALGFAGITFGIWWMRRLYTAGLRADSDGRWRYRDR